MLSVINLVETPNLMHQFLDFCDRESKTEEPAAKNMGLEFYGVFSRFQRNGRFDLVIEDGEIIACGGAYISDFSPDIAVAGARTWATKEARHRRIIRDHILTTHKRWAMDKGMKIATLTFNQYNKNLRELFFRRPQRFPERLFHLNFTSPDFPVMIQNTPQWVLYEKFTDWDFDWESIRAVP